MSAFSRHPGLRIRLLVLRLEVDEGGYDRTRDIKNNHSISISATFGIRDHLDSDLPSYVHDKGFNRSCWPSSVNYPTLRRWRDRAPTF